MQEAVFTSMLREMEANIHEVQAPATAMTQYRAVIAEDKEISQHYDLPTVRKYFRKYGF